MEIIYLKNDGRCKWLERQVLNKLFPDMIECYKSKTEIPQYLILDWMSNENGKVGVDLKWLKKTGIPYLENLKALPEGNKFKIVNTGYDSIYEEEMILKEKGIEIIDKPCPYVRKVRTLFENVDENYQYILLCESNHIIIKNFASLFPEDMILVQMSNYKEKIIQYSNGKPFIIISHVTFLKRNSDEILYFVQEKYPGKDHRVIDTQCVWVNSRVSPINEINELSETLVKQIDYACLIGTPGSVNKSALTLIETIEGRGMRIKYISSLKDFILFKRKNQKSKILLVRTPIPNKVEKPVMIYLEKGWFPAIKYLITERLSGK
jgi:4-hydroxy-3-methylbut-2-enyl diphosphate reductase IspH